MNEFYDVREAMQFAFDQAALKAKRAQVCGHKDSLGHPKNIETRRLSCLPSSLDPVGRKRCI